MENAVKKNLADGILLSGGLDTSIIATLASKYKLLTAITLSLQDAPSPDVEYASQMAKLLKFDHIIYTFNYDELNQALPHTIKTLNSFDPMEIRNSVVIFIGLRIAKETGVETILTGDGADELFAGYSYLFNFEKEQLDTELKRLSSIMVFSSIPLARSLKMEAKLPYLDPEFKKFAASVNPEYKIHRQNGIVIGKWILRKTYEGFLPDAIIWRSKAPIELGSGTAILPDYFDHKISDKEFQEKKLEYLNKDNVSIRDKEQLFYYEIYRSVIGVPKSTDKNKRICPQCNSNVHKQATYCRTCGAYPI